LAAFSYAPSGFPLWGFEIQTLFHVLLVERQFISRRFSSSLHFTFFFNVEMEPTTTLLK